MNEESSATTRPGPGRPLGRRRVLALAAAGTVGLAAAGTGWWSTRSPALLDRAALRRAEPLTQPPVLTPSPGQDRLALVAGRGARIAGVDAAGYSYNGTSPGPTITVRPGDELRLRLTNRLLDPTNLHTHGLRVSPSGQSDNPFTHAEPDGSLDYVIRIPADHRHHPARRPHASFRRQRRARARARRSTHPRRGPRLGPDPGRVHRADRAQRLPLPHPRSRRRRDDGNCQRDAVTRRRPGARTLELPPPLRGGPSSRRCGRGGPAVWGPTCRNSRHES